MADPNHAASSDQPTGNWREALAVYTTRRVLVMLFLGFSAGLPYLLVGATLSAWLTEAGSSRTAIGFFAWVGIAYSIKVFWAPIVDRLRLPFFGNWLGQRRSWLLLAQLGIAFGLVDIALGSPEQGLFRLAVFALIIAFSSATQDIVIDAYRIEAVEEKLQGAMSATYVFGYRLSLLVAGAGALYLAEFFGWRLTYLAMAGLMSVGFITVLLIAEPDAERKPFRRESRNVGPLQRLAHWGKGAVVEPFTDFFVRYGWFALVILALISVFRLSDIVMGIMANPFYLDLGYSKLEIANVTKVFGLAMTLLGSGICGVLVVRYGILGPLWAGAIAVMTTNLLFAALAVYGKPDLIALTLVISADNISGGVATTAFIAYLSSLTSRGYTATQYALFSSVMNLPGKFISGFGGVLVDSYGYVQFFLTAAALGLPAIVLVPIVWRYLDNKGQGQSVRAAT